MSISPYFFQTSEWARFWKSANLPGHDFFIVENSGFYGLVYQYPWFFGQNFLYLPFGPVIKEGQDKNQDLENYWKDYWEMVMVAATSRNCSFVKIDVDESTTNSLGIFGIDQLVANLSATTRKKVTISPKKIQYHSVMELDLRPCYPTDVSANLLEFYHATAKFWNTTNQNVRRYTKKSLDQGWQIKTYKTEEIFENFWKIYVQTSQRQDFFIYSKEYIQQAFWNSNSRIIVMYDSHGPQACWLGWVSGKSLIYLYGGNTQTSFDAYGQYLIHLLAIKQAVTENLTTYDLGSVDPRKGFSQFKMNYRGSIRSSIGPVDIILQPRLVWATDSVIRIAKILRKS